MSEGGKPPGLMATPLTAQGNIQLENRIRDRITKGTYRKNAKLAITNRRNVTKRLNILKNGYSKMKRKNTSDKIERLTRLLDEINTNAGPSVEQEEAPYVPFVEDEENSSLASPVMPANTKSKKNENVPQPRPNASMSDLEKTAFDIHCPGGVIDGCLFTKEKRQELYGKVAGGGGSKKPEDNQKQQIVLGTGRACNTTQTRINWRKNEMVENSQPMRKEDGFDYTENFDGKQLFSPYTVWVNLKSVVGTGGSQTRTLRDECYPFVNAQLNYLLKTKRTDYFFANIFDGDEAAAKMKMFRYLLALPEFSSVKKYIYVGDLKGYFAWIKANVV